MALFFCKNRSNNPFRHMPLLSYFNVHNANIVRFYLNNKIVLLSSFPYNFHNFSGTPSLVILVFSSIRWRIHSYPTPQQPITTSQRIPLIPQQFEVVALKRLDSNSLVTDRGRCHQGRLLWSYFFVGRKRCGGKNMRKKTWKNVNTRQDMSVLQFICETNTTNINLEATSPTPKIPKKVVVVPKSKYFTST